MQNKYVLPKGVVPVKYEIDITPDFNDFTFAGEESIHIKIKDETNKIVLNSDGLEIISASVKGNELKKDIDAEFQRLTLFLTKEIKGNLILKIKFRGKADETMRGFYKSKYMVNKKEKIMFTTQFEPSDARKLFPCFDEPALKAKFSIKLNIPENLNAVSNMPVKSQKIKNKIKTVEFEETPIMSTYLLALVIGEFEFIEGKTKDNTLIRIITTPGKKKLGKFALDTTIKILEYYNDYFKIPYPLPKLDQIAIPDFESGAMENWGLITYRETAILFDKNNSSESTKQRIALVISHEIAHQWFGNLVTMKWWNDLWLNEGFASWMEYKPIDYIFPEWDIWTQFFYLDTMGAFSLDSLESTHKIEVEVNNPNEINEIFDEISYSKGASIIRMLEGYLGEDVFKKGIQNYLSRFKYGNTETKDLWKSLQESSGKPVKKIMDSWTRQEGYPIIHVSSNILKQERFSLNKKHDRTLWYIPLRISGKSYEFNKREIKIKEFGLINESQKGFYRVNYSDSIKKINIKKLNNIDKIGIENDIYELSKANYSKITDFLDLTKEFKDETDYVLWADLSSNISQLRLLFSRQSFEAYIIDLYREILGKLGWDRKKNDDHQDVLLRPVILSMMGLTNDKGIINEAKRRFSSHLKANNLDANIRLQVYSISAKNGDKNIYNQLKNLYMKSDLQEEKVRALYSLGKFRDEKILREFLEFILSDEVKSQNVNAGVSSVARNPKGMLIAWEFFKDNYERFEKKIGKSGHGMPRLIKTLLGDFSYGEMLGEIKEFFEKKDIKNSKRAIKESLESIKHNYKFKRDNEEIIEKWLKKKDYIGG